MKNERNSPRKVLLEICCASVDDAIAAALGGADRIELCSAMALGGLTPSAGAILQAKSCLRIPVMVMVRPRSFGFCYSPMETDVMAIDTGNAIEAGADGIVFGILKEDGTVDRHRCRHILDLIGDRQSVFHRAFDVTPDPFRALDELIDLGVTRVLTGGQRNAAWEGRDLIKKLIEYSCGRIEIMPGGGIRVQTIKDVIEETGCKQVHMTAFRPRHDTSTAARPAVTLNAQISSESRYDATDSSLVEQIVRNVEILDVGSTTGEEWGQSASFPTCAAAHTAQCEGDSNGSKH